MKTALKLAFSVLHMAGVVLFCLGLTTTSGYVANRNQLHTWIKGSTPMALPTGLGFMVAGIASLTTHKITRRHQERLNGAIPD